MDFGLASKFKHPFWLYFNTCSKTLTEKLGSS
jgi:hypothetical protein